MKELLVIHPVQGLGDGRGVRAERVVPQRLRRLAVTDEVGQEHPVVLVHLVDEVGPLPLRPEDPVDEEHDRTGPAVHVRELVGVQHDGARSRM